MSRLRFLPLFIAVLAMLSACGERAGTERKYPAPPRDMVAINLGTDPQSLDPNIASDIPSAQVLNHLFEPLVRLDVDGLPQPALATRWEHNDDFTVWTFHLRKDNIWHNGDPVTAKDFIYALRRIMDPATASTYSMMVYVFVKGGEEFFNSGADDSKPLGLRAIDDHTLEITLENPTPFFLSILNHSAWYPLHRQTVERHGDRWMQAGNHVGNGPFRLKEYRAKDRIIIEKFAGYFDADKVPLGEIHYLMISEGNTEIASFLSGTLHITGIVPPREAPRWRNDPAFNSFPMLGIYYVGMNNTRPPFDDVHLRKAFSYSINRQQIVERIARRGELPANGIVPHQVMMPNGQDYRSLAPAYYTGDHATNLQKAKEHLRAGGYAVDGQPGKPIPRIEYLYNVDDLHEDIAQNMQFTWRTELGATVDLQKLEFVVLLSRGAGRDFTAMRSSWIGDYLDPMTFLEIFQSKHGKNYAGYNNPRYDELLALAREEGDWEKRMEYLVEAERLLIDEDCVIAPIYEYRNSVLIRPELKGVVYNPLGNLYLARAHWEGGE